MYVGNNGDEDIRRRGRERGCGSVVEERFSDK